MVVPSLNGEDADAFWRAVEGLDAISSRRILRALGFVVMPCPETFSTAIYEPIFPAALDEVKLRLRSWEQFDRAFELLAEDPQAAALRFQAALAIAGPPEAVALVDHNAHTVAMLRSSDFSQTVSHALSSQAWQLLFEALR